MTPIVLTRPRGVPMTGLAVVLMVVSTVGVCQSDEKQPSAPDTESKEIEIFDGKTLDGWRIIKDFDFKKRGKVYVQDGVIHLERGKPATGITWKKEFPRSNYELSLEGQRVEGTDFFLRADVSGQRRIRLANLGRLGRSGDRAIEHRRVFRSRKRNHAGPRFQDGAMVPATIARDRRTDRVLAGRQAAD